MKELAALNPTQQKNSRELLSVKAGEACKQLGSATTVLSTTFYDTLPSDIFQVRKTLTSFISS